MSIFILMGKSSTGKDTIYGKLLERMNINPVVIHTTRDKREGEIDGKTYYFDNYEKYKYFVDEDKVIESRSYNILKNGESAEVLYYTVLDDQFNGNDDKIIIGVPDMYPKFVKFFGNEVYPILISLDDGVRIKRALSREEKQKNPNYLEMCRRFISDNDDFSDKRLEECGIVNFPIFINDNLDRCVDQIEIYINAMISISKNKISWKEMM